MAQLPLYLFQIADTVADIQMSVELHCAYHFLSSGSPYGTVILKFA